MSPDAACRCNPAVVAAGLAVPAGAAYVLARTGPPAAVEAEP